MKESSPEEIKKFVDSGAGWGMSVEPRDPNAPKPEHETWDKIVVKNPESKEK